MNSEEKERRCKACGKLLLDEKSSFCRRCVLEGRNKTGQVGGIIGGLAMSALSIFAMINNKPDSNNTT